MYPSRRGGDARAVHLALLASPRTFSVSSRARTAHGDPRRAQQSWCAPKWGPEVVLLRVHPTPLNSPLLSGQSLMLAVWEVTRARPPPKHADCPIAGGTVIRIKNNNKENRLLWNRTVSAGTFSHRRIPKRNVTSVNTQTDRRRHRPRRALPIALRPATSFLPEDNGSETTVARFGTATGLWAVRSAPPPGRPHGHSHGG